MSTRSVGIYIAVVVILVACAALWRSSRTTTTAPQLASDLYPLYSGVSWSAPTDKAFAVGTTTITGINATSSTVTDTMDPSSVFTPFDDYYTQKLAAAGWGADNALAANGPVGGLTGYQKGDQLIIAGYDIAYVNTQDAAPLRCPCDVTLTLFSGHEGE